MNMYQIRLYMLGANLGMKGVHMIPMTFNLIVGQLYLLGELRGMKGRFLMKMLKYTKGAGVEH